MLRILMLMLAPLPIQPMKSGARVRIGQIAQGLARHSALTLVAPDAGADKQWADAAPFRYVGVPWSPPGRRQQVQSWASVWPYPVALRYCPRLAQTVNELLATEAYDLKAFQQTYTQERAIQRYAAFIGQQLW